MVAAKENGMWGCCWRFVTKEGEGAYVPRNTLPELIGIEEAVKWTPSQTTLACISDRISRACLLCYWEGNDRVD